MESVFFSVNINHQSSGILFIISRIYKLFWLGAYDISIDFFVFFSLFLIASNVLCYFFLVSFWALFLVGWFG